MSKFARVMDGHWAIDINYYPTDDESGDMTLYAVGTCTHCGGAYHNRATLDSGVAEGAALMEHCDQLDALKVAADKILDRLSRYKLPAFCEKCGKDMAKEPSDTWIPVSDHNPSKNGRYMVTIKNTGKPHVEMANYDKVSDTWNYNMGSYLPWHIGVVAWRNRPEPYFLKEEDK